MQRVPRGFTLLELMVVLVIIGICTAGIGLGLGSLLDPGRQLRQEAEQLAQRLQVARDEARSMAAPCAGRPTPPATASAAAKAPVGWMCSATTCCAHNHGSWRASRCSRPRRLN